MEKTYPAGVNKFGYESDISLGVLPFRGKATLRALTMTVAKNTIKFPNCNTESFLDSFILCPVQDSVRLGLRVHTVNVKPSPNSVQVVFHYLPQHGRRKSTLWKEKSDH